MPVHDWGKVPDGIFHAFHHIWVTTLHLALNDGVLPDGYYALPDQVAGPGHPDVLGLQEVSPAGGKPPRLRRADGGLALAEPATSFHDIAPPRAPTRRGKRLAIRHVSGDRVVALVEIVSHSNKAARDELRAFADKLAGYIEGGIHILVLDLLPAHRKYPNGIHPLIWRRFKRSPFQLPPDKPLTLAGYAAGPRAEAFVTPVGVGDPLPEMPLFLTPERYVNVPLEPSYQAAWVGMPPRSREVLEPPAG
ncbi:MAG: DUF4058 family protein [Gemmataceae bacterium]|nr:DUF4058 family protein [Gemmataceae bacterium]